MLIILSNFGFMKESFNIILNTAKAVESFWRTKNKQLKQSSDSSNRGAVVGGKQLDGFLKLLRDTCLSVGVPYLWYALGRLLNVDWG